MSGRKWFVLFLAALASVFVAWGLFNWVVDPFNAFDGGLMPWDSYSMTLAPRNAKVCYLSKHFDEYDSYIIGSSTASSYLPQTMEKYVDGHFYNAFHYGADPAFDRTLVEYLLTHDDDVRRIVLVLGLNDGNAVEAKEKEDLTAMAHYALTGESRLRYAMRYLFANPDYALEKLRSFRQDTILPQPFDVFLPERGIYDKRIREVEPIGSYAAYLEKHGDDFATYCSGEKLSDIDTCIENVAAIRALCENAGVELTVILSPVCDSQLREYEPESIDTFFQRLASVTDYWNCAISPLTYDERFYYDTTHTRNATANMVISRVFSDTDVYIPESFGVYCSGSSPTTAELSKRAKQVEKSSYTAMLPVLLYHHIQPEGNGESCISSAAFEHQMALLRDNGYQTVSFAEAIACVKQGKPLPEHAVAVTFDDGYLSNYEYAYPVLRNNGQCATIFLIGSSIGHDQYYKDTPFKLTPHFGATEIASMADTIVVGSHSYDMHQWPPYEPEGAPVRESVLPLPGESEDDHYRAVVADAQIMAETFRTLGLEPSNLFAFPRGEHDTASDVALMENGYEVTLTTDSTRINTLVMGLPQSLVDLGRYAPSNETTDEQLLAYLEMCAD